MIQRPIKAIFFDWDGTLAYTDIPNNSTSGRLAMMFQMGGLPYTQPEMEAALQQYAADAGPEMMERFGKAQTRREITGHYAQLLKRLGHQDRSWELTLDLYRTYAGLPWLLYEDSCAIIEAVRDKGYIVGILSNHSHSARPIMTQMVGDLVPARNIIISEEAGVHKPAKTIYLRAASRVRTPPANCLLVGDNLTADAVGAVQNGGFGRGIWLDRKQQHNGHLLPPHISYITSLVQLLDLLDDSL